MADNVHEQKRISQLSPAVVEQGRDIVTEIISSRTEAAKWSVPVDYVKPAGETVDYGTKQVTMDRVALLTTTGVVPASMLPSYVAATKTGTMEYTSSPVKWRFIYTENSEEHVCAYPTGAGEEAPSVDYVYAHRDDANQDYQQYRFVPPSTAGGSDGAFVPIPSDLILKDGSGTKVTDSFSNYTRQIDLTIGSPVSSLNPLVISGGKLCHAQGASGPYPATQPTQTPGFGSSFNVPSITVSSSGHVTAGSTVAITVPSTAATAGATGVAGLVRIGATAPSSIGQTASAGGATGPGGYVYVAAADHVHNAATLTLNNVGASGTSTVTYNGATGASYDFRNVLKAVLPESAPGADRQILTVVPGATGATGLAAYQAQWASADSVITPVYLFATVGSGGISTSDTTMKLSAVTDAGELALSSNAVTGIRANKNYMVSYNISIQVQSAGVNLVDIAIGAKIGSGTASVNRHVIDESIYGASGALSLQWVSGTIFVKEATAGNLTLVCSIPNISNNVSWQYTGGTVQVVEVK